MANRKKSPAKRPKEKTPRASKPKSAKASKAVTPSGKPDTKVERFTRSLRCNLEAGDLAAMADRMAHVIGEKENLVAQSKSATAHLKAQIKEKDAEIGKLSAQIRDKAEYREVDCERRHLYRIGKVVEIRLDTEEQVDERAMTAHERQLELPTKKPGEVVKLVPKTDEKPPKTEGDRDTEPPGPKDEDEQDDDEDDSDDAPPSEDEPSVGDANEAEQTGDVPAE
jgi:hypothetical protein